MTILRIGTRRSDLAMWQAVFVRDALMRAHPDLNIELVGITTEGDRTLDVPLASKGGKGLFLKELEQALLEHRIDLAVHSMKDVTVTEPEGLHIPVICERENPCDALVSSRYADLQDLPVGAVVGTCSLRRQAVLRHRFPELEVENLRGNVNRRLARLDAGDFDAIILATAGLVRLQMQERIRQIIAPEVMLPAVGQGAVGIQCRLDDDETSRLLSPLDHPATHLRVRAERAVNAELGGGCHVPIGAYAEIQGEQLSLCGLVGRPDGSEVLFAAAEGQLADPEAIGRALAEDLLSQGAQTILQSVADG
ncbi:MAG: hydroxymethylbilane synthase [Arenicellales bacterium]|nr:hydroxymethylbilane synthase [Arenicellales bacterium]MDP6792128.1 hydroxymethylbilane synthase [Arenicellales bacterium]